MEEWEIEWEKEKQSKKQKIEAVKVIVNNLQDDDIYNSAKIKRVRLTIHDLLKDM